MGISGIRGTVNNAQRVCTHQILFWVMLAADHPLPHLPRTTGFVQKQHCCSPYFTAGLEAAGAAAFDTKDAGASVSNAGGREAAIALMVDRAVSWRPRLELSFILSETLQRLIVMLVAAFSRFTAR